MVHMETLDKHFRVLTKAAFVRHGFASEQLISQWGVIAGEAFAAFSVPDKIKWPRTALGVGDVNTKKFGGTLVVRAAAGRALELHYETPRLIERVNQFLGYGAITSIKIVQSNLPTKMTKVEVQPMTPEASAAWAGKINDIADDDLKAALARLAAHAAPNGPKTDFSTGENRDWPHPSTSVRKKP
jgi:hypothetical protein